MAVSHIISKRLTPYLTGRVQLASGTHLCRLFSKDNSTTEEEDEDMSSGKRKGVFSWLGPFGKERMRREKSHAKLLTGTSRIYELQFHTVKPDRVGDYIKLCESTLPAINENENVPGKLLGSWITRIGRQDQAVHMFLHSHGYETYKATHDFVRKDPDIYKMILERDKLLVKRSNQLCQDFDFWGDVKPRTGGHIYELRTYYLKPGNLIEWASHWSKGIRYRKQFNEAVCGLFTQIGSLYTVHHLWAYKDLMTRAQARENSWNVPGWDECVMLTVPLIRRMETDLLIPMSCSLLQ